MKIHKRWQVESVSKVCSNPDAPETLAWLWSSLCVAAAAIVTAYVLARFVIAKDGGTFAGSNSKLGAALVGLWAKARVRRVRRAFVGLLGLGIYWFDVITDILVSASVVTCQGGICVGPWPLYMWEI